MAKKIEFSQDDIKLAAIAKAMSHPARVYILKKLSSMDACCYSGDLVEELPIGRSTLSQHLKELKHAELIQGEINPPFIKYCINLKNWENASKIFSELFKDYQPKTAKDEKKKCVQC
ncbi:MAG: helix-turn-helix transcriptional regulator [Bacteroidetes bacterium]|nr:helix-turn-helix transcriptional regulator [Bacteroidota bacterium]